jgi:hypothetical protein
MVYLLHFDRPYRHVSHFLTVAPPSSLTPGARVPDSAILHSPLLAAATADGIAIVVARAWCGSGRTRQQLAAHKNAKRFCAICNPRAADGAAS